MALEHVGLPRRRFDVRADRSSDACSCDGLGAFQHGTSVVEFIMATRKLHKKLPVDPADDVDRLARGRRVSMAALLTEAVREVRRHQAALAAIADYEAEFGRFTEAELEDTRARLAGMAWKGSPS
jgi:hypothetical protein